jgi:Ribonuclease G/E
VHFGAARVEPANGLRVNVTNVGPSAQSAHVDVYDAAGALLDSGDVGPVATNATAEISFNFCCLESVRAVVTGGSGARLIATQEVFDPSGRTLGLMEEEGIYYF